MKHIRSLMTVAALSAAAVAHALPMDGLHPDSDTWPLLFSKDLSNAEDTKGVWFRDADGNLTASKDVLLFSKKEYGPFVLDLEFRYEPGANSGVYIYASDLNDLVPNKIEVQLLDDPAPRWKDCTSYQRTAALFGHCKPKAEALRPTGEWNRMTIFAQGQKVRIVLNGVEVIDEDLSGHTSNKVNPDGSAVPPRHTKPWAEIAKRGRIGLQGKHQGAATFFRNIRVKEGECADGKQAAPEKGKASPVTLRRGEVTVVTVDGPNDGYLRYIAYEMTNFLARALGVPVPYLHKSLPEKGVAIIIGTNSWSRAAGLAPELLKRDGYRIKATKNRVYLTGVDEPGWVSERINRPWDMCTQHASVFAAYDFLERFCGFRFYFPGEYGIIIPQGEKIELPAIDYTSEPDFRVRRYSHSLTYGDGPMPTEWGNTNYVNLSNRQRLRMRMASEFLPCCHGQYTGRFSARFKDTHPEYFRLRKDGTRHTEDSRRPPCSANAHLCQSSKIWDELYLDAEAYFTGKDAKTRGLDRWAQQAANGCYYDVMPNDGMPLCECQTCKEWFAKAKDPRYPYTPLVWTKTVELANRLKRNGIHGTITQMAYSSYRGLPDIDLPDNLAVQVAEIGPWAERNKTVMDRDDAEVRAWAKKVKGGVWLWNYVGKFQCAGWNLAGVPIVTPHSVGRYYKRIAGDVFGAYMEIFAETYVWQYLNVYVFSRLAWDNRTDPEAVIAEHHRLMFGKGAAAMAKFFDEIERAWVYEISGRTYDSPLGPASVAARDYEVWTRIYTPERLASFVRLFDEAAASVPPGSMEARRIAFMRREFLDVMQREAAKCLKTIDIAEEEAYRAKNPDRTIFPGGDCSSLDGWKVECGDVTIDRTVFRSAPGAIKLVATDASSDKDGPFLRAAVTIPLPKLKPDRYYRLSWYEKLENVTPCGTYGGFSMCMCDTVDRSWPWPNYHVGTTGWFRQYYDLKTRPGSNAEGQSYLRPRIVTGTGTVWIDDIRLEEHK